MFGGVSSLSRAQLHFFPEGGLRKGLNLSPYRPLPRGGTTYHAHRDFFFEFSISFRQYFVGDERNVIISVAEPMHNTSRQNRQPCQPRNITISEFTWLGNNSLKAFIELLPHAKSPHFLNLLACWFVETDGLNHVDIVADVKPYYDCLYLPRISTGQ